MADKLYGTDAILAQVAEMIKTKMTVQVVVGTGPDVELTLLWDGVPFNSSEDGVCSGQGGPQD